MTVRDPVMAARLLERLGYYRLSGYWYPFRESEASPNNEGRPVTTVLDRFRPGTDFEHVHDLYVFDKRLRLLMLDAVERIEVGLRVSVAHILGPRDPWAHRNPVQLSADFASRTDRETRLVKHVSWLSRHDALTARSKDEFVRHFRGRYDSPLPIWMAIELWDFGVLSTFIEGLKTADQDALAARFSIPRRELLTSWTHAINYVRNVCAHHGRLWNRAMVIMPKQPRRDEIALLDHIAPDAPSLLPGIHPAMRLYGAAAVMQFLLRTINPTTSWPTRLRDHLAAFRFPPGLGEAQMGFPRGWAELPLWQQPT